MNSTKKCLDTLPKQSLVFFYIYCNQFRNEIDYYAGPSLSEYRYFSMTSFKTCNKFRGCLCTYTKERQVAPPLVNRKTLFLRIFSLNVHVSIIFSLPYTILMQHNNAVHA